MLVADLMTSQLRCLKETDCLGDALAAMQELFIRHVPVVDDEGHLSGLVTQRDLLALEHKKDAGTALREIMRTDVATVTPDTPLRAAAETMIFHKYGCLPVVADGELVGIITETDFLKLAIFPIAPRREG
ncbi:CBS domain-containing protein [Solidesulfovibrio sp.]